MGTVKPVVVSPLMRSEVNAPLSDLPVVLSEPADFPLTVRSVLLEARPVTVRSLDAEITDVALSRRVRVPLAVMRSRATRIVLRLDVTPPTQSEAPRRCALRCSM